MEVIINVTYKDIEEGIPQKIDCCPVALAVKRAFPSAESVSVSTDNYDEDMTMQIEVKMVDDIADDYYVLELNRHDDWMIQNFIGKFDRHEQVLPFSFKTFIDYEVDK